MKRKHAHVLYAGREVQGRNRALGSMCEKGTGSSQLSSSVKEIIFVNTVVRVLACVIIAVFGAMIDDFDQSEEHRLDYYQRAIHSFSKWDGVHLINIAENGYEYEHVSK